MILRVIRGSLFIAGLAGMVVWFYVIIRILSTGIIPNGVTVLGVHLSFWGWGIIAFVLSFAFMVLFVIAGGVPHRSRSSGRA